MELLRAETLSITKIRDLFPILHQTVNGKPLIYFDNAATTQKPKGVLETLKKYYEEDNANIHRGIHTLAERATVAFEETRQVLRQFINAGEEGEIVFTKGVTEGINLVAQAYGRKFLNAGDEIIISGLEHHSNIVPWQLIAEEKGVFIKVIDVLEDGSLDVDQFKTLLSSKTKMVAVNHASNSLGTINPIEEIIAYAHDAGAKVLIDGAQATAHLEIDVQHLDCDFYVLSAHKSYGPTGVGVLYGKRELLEAMPPYQGGGEMIKEVSFAKTDYNDIPYKFEAGTPNIAGVVAFKSALELISILSKEQIADYENYLLNYATKQIASIPKIRIVGNATRKVSVLSFVVEGIHHFDIGQMLDAAGVAVRTGHHCTQPLMNRFGIEGTVRASFAIYNTTGEIDKMTEALRKIIPLMA